MDSQKQQPVPVIDTDTLNKLNAAIVLLGAWNLPTKTVVEALGARLDEQRKQPTDEDRKWQHTPPEVIGEHLSLGDNRPTLSCALMVGRAYALTPGQRDYIRDHYNMTPARLVKITEVALYPGTSCIRRVTLISEEHVDPRRRKMTVKLAIDNWGQFCTESKANDDARKVDLEPDPEGSDDRVGQVKPKGATKAKQPTISDLMGQYGID